MGLVAVPTVVAWSKQAEPHVGEAVGTDAVRPCHREGEREIVVVSVSREIVVMMDPSERGE